MERIGFVGLGTMGASMAANLARAGAPLTVWNRTAGRASALLELGAREAATPAELAAASDVVVVCVSHTPDVEAILFGSAGVSDGAAPGALIIDCSTISPAATRDFGSRLAERGFRVAIPRGLMHLEAAAGEIVDRWIHESTEAHRPVHKIQMIVFGAA